MFDSLLLDVHVPVFGNFARPTGSRIRIRRQFWRRSSHKRSDNKGNCLSSYSYWSSLFLGLKILALSSIFRVPCGIFSRYNSGTDQLYLHWRTGLRCGRTIHTLSAYEQNSENKSVPKKAFWVVYLLQCKAFLGRLFGMGRKFWFRGSVNETKR